jgi:hypothetical protein
MEKQIDHVSIEIKQATFLILRLLPNKVWNVLAEYVDNALSSSRIDRNELKKKGNYKFVVRIDVTDTQIKIYDNAGGINSKEFERALELANLPTNKAELNEFGMGMKTSSVWLGDLWTLRSASINETMERSVEFDLNKVVANEIKSLKVKSVKKSKDLHFTEIIIKNLSDNAPSTYQFDKIKDHLSSIYRIPIRTREMQLYFNGVLLEYEEPKILKAAPYKSPTGKAIEWKYPIDFPLGKYRIKGYVGILEKMSNNLHNGLSLFKKGRVIQGSHDEKYRPDVLFGKDPGSALYKGLFGELELIGFEVTYNKGTFRDIDSLEKVMVEVKKLLSNPKNNFIGQASNYSRSNTKQDNLKAAQKLIASFKKERKKAPLKEKIKQLAEASKNKAQNKINREHFRKAKSIAPQIEGEIIEFGGKKFNLKWSPISSSSIDSLFSIFDEGTKKGVNTIHYKINLAHPFFSKYSKIFKNNYDPIKDLIEAFVIAEITTAGVVKFGDKIRDNFNNYIKTI